MLSESENVRRNPLSAEEARFKELLTKHVDYSLDLIILDSKGRSEDLVEAQRRITEVAEQMRDGIPLR